MKNISKRLFTLVLAMVMMAGFALSSSAAGIVTYESKEFDFAPGTEYSVSDLFTDFKNLMPGDSITQIVRLVNNGKSKTTTKFYLKATGPAAETDEDLKFNGANGNLGDADDTDGYPEKVFDNSLLSQLKMTVKVVKNNKTIFDAPANETATLSDWVYLGSLRKGGEIDLEVTVEVPAEMGNEFRDLAGAINWSVKIEEIPDTEVPNTGDTSGTMMYTLLLGGAALMLIVVLLLKKRTDEK